MITYTDFLFCNRDEALMASRQLAVELEIEPASPIIDEVPDVEGKLKEVASNLAKFKKLNDKPRCVVITNSADPVCVSYMDQTFMVPVEQLDHSLLKDSNAAGDSFVGGFIAKICQMIEEKQSQNFSPDEIKQAVLVGNSVARVVIQHYGCQF